MHYGSTSNSYDNQLGSQILTVSGIDPFGGSSNYWGSILQWSDTFERYPNDGSHLDSWYNQLMGLANDLLFFRTRTNGNNWTSWKQVAFTSDLGGYLPTSGGTISNGNWGAQLKLERPGGTPSLYFSKATNDQWYLYPDVFDINNKWIVGYTDTSGVDHAATLLHTGNYTSYCASISHTHSFSDITDGYCMSTSGGWSHVLCNNYGGSAKAQLYMCHGEGYGMHIRGYSNSSLVYMLEIYNDTTQLFALYGDGHANLYGRLQVSADIDLYGYLKMYSPTSGTCIQAIDRSGDSPIFGYAHGQYGYHVYYTGYTVSINAGSSWSSIGNGIYINTNNNVGIGTYSPGYKLEVNGNAAASNFYTTSDRSKKQDITLFSEHIKKFQLKNTEKYAYGVIAQEVEEMFRDGEEGNMTVNYNSVLSYYVGLLENKVTELEQELNELKAKYDAKHNSN